MEQSTLVYCLKHDSVLLGYKKRGFGKGILNGFGGKILPYETPEETAVLELHEESNLLANLNDLEKIAEIDFEFNQSLLGGMQNHHVHVYLLRSWEGKPVETEEMRPEWYKKNNLPFDRMWPDSFYWLPLVLKGHHIEGKFILDETGHKIVDYEIRVDS